MKLLDIIEGIKNTSKLFDIIRGNQIVAREIRQTYNKVIRGKVKSPLEKLNLIRWAEYQQTSNQIGQNTQLIQMLDEIIKRCSK
jgi:hypothetical protein